MNNVKRLDEEKAPYFSFPLRDRIIQEGIGVKLIACVDGLPHPKVISKNVVKIVLVD